MREYHNNETEQIARAFVRGDVLAFPTDTVYGVGVMRGNPDALARLKQIKHRPEVKPIPMMCASLEQVADFAKIPPMAQTLADAFLPGALTLILKLHDQADRQYTNGMDTAAVRIPNAPVLLEIMRQLPYPLLVTSANVSGEPAALCLEDAIAMLPALDGVLDGECQATGLASTIVDCTGENPVILRQGPIKESQILEVWQGKKGKRTDCVERFDNPSQNQ